VEGRFKLALWCEEHKLKEQMNAEIERVLALNPNHDGANQKLGRINYQGQWRTPDELKKLGFVKKDGQWMTPDEAAKADGKVTYMGNWVRPDDVKRFEGRQFSRYTDAACGFTTHGVCEINKQIMRLELLNMWKPTPDQLKRMWTVLNQAEADRQMFHAKMDKSAPDIEAAWIALRNEALKGVVDSFAQDPVVERRASSMEGIWKAVNKGVRLKLYKDYNDKFMAILTSSQRGDFMNKYCTMCHSASYVKGGYGQEIRGTQAGVDFLEKVRALPEDEFNKQMCSLAEEALKKFGKGPQTVLGKKAKQAGAKRSAQDMDAEEMVVADIMKRARVETDNGWARSRFNYSAEIEAKNQEERLEIIKSTGKKEKGAYVGDVKTQKMVADALFDGSLREVVGMKLGIPASQIAAVKPSADANVVPEFADGKTACEQMCTMCHDMNRVDKAIKTPEYWRETVVKRLHGAAIDDQKLIDQITEYLVNRGAGGAQAQAK
jgi:cytochrome c5